jgi:allophanate hydrolase
VRNSAPDGAQDLQAAPLRAAYLAGDQTPESVIDAVYARIAERGDDHVWISLVPRDEALTRARELGRRLRGPGELPPLFGLPFAVKDNIDVAGLPTTAACPSFAYLPTVSAPLVARLLAAGAICVGKTNLDQFATGLTGTRSPYGTPRSPFGADLIPGGSSSGSGVAVAAGLVTFAIGTDTAGSGRVPAALTNTVGLKPTRGLVSGRGMVPACRSLDCPSVFALSVPDAQAVLSVIAGYDPHDPWSRRLPPVPAPVRPPRVGVLPAPAREFFGDTGAAAGYDTALGLLADAGATCVPFDVEPFLAAGTLLYGGPWLAERTAAIGTFLDAHRDEIHPVTRAVLAPGATITGAEVFGGIATLRALRRQVDACWDDLDMIAVPTVPTTYTLAEVAADPVTLNANLGRYTTFANLLDLAAVAVPAGFAAGLPFGVTLAGPAGSDAALCALAADLHARAGLPVGAGRHPLAPSPASPGKAAVPAVRAGMGGGVDLAVVGAHMSGLGLNGQLTSLGGTFVRCARTRADYRLFALPGTEPARPGLVRVGHGGVAIEAEIWRLPTEAVGIFLAGVPAPLAIGTVALDGGDSLGFLCEAHATAGALDISTHGGWRAYLASLP